MESHPIVILVVVVLLVLGSPGLDRIQVPLAPGVPRNRFHETRGPQPGRHGFACGGAGAGAASCWWFGTTLPPRTNPGTTTRSEVWGGAMVVVVVVVVFVAIAIAIDIAVTTSFDGLGPERRVPAAAGCHRLVPGDCFCRWHQGKRA